MRLFGWIVEQLCRPLDTKVCSIANATDEQEGVSAFPGYYLSA